MKLRAQSGVDRRAAGARRSNVTRSAWWGGGTLIEPRAALVEDALADLLGVISSKPAVVDREDNGLRASRRIVSEQPDAVVLDVGLPGIDGLEVCRRVREDYAGVILMLTARGDELDQVLGLELGADAYVTKPTSPRVLVARLKALLRRAQGEWGDPERIEVGRLTLERLAARNSTDSRWTCLPASSSCFGCLRVSQER